MRRETSLEYLDRRLTRAARILSDCAGLTRDLDLNRRENIRRIGEALARIFEIQHEIYELRPELKPDYLQKEPPGKNEPR